MATDSVTEPGPARPQPMTMQERILRLRLERFALLFGVLLYALWATRITWPLMRDPGHSLLGELRRPVGGIAHMREWIQAGQFPFLPGRVHDFAAPEGLPVSWGINLGNWPYLLPTWLLALVIGPIAAYSLITWLAFVLNGLLMQIVATRLTGSRLAGIVAGFGFAFVPFVVDQRVGPRPVRARVAAAADRLADPRGRREADASQRDAGRRWRPSSPWGSPRTTSSSAGCCC